VAVQRTATYPGRRRAIIPLAIALGLGITQSQWVGVSVIQCLTQSFTVAISVAIRFRQPVSPPVTVVQWFGVSVSIGKHQPISQSLSNPFTQRQPVGVTISP
jgi:hypothetical protein